MAEMSIQQQVMDLFDSLVRELPAAEYRELLEEISSDLKSRLECVIEEMAEED